VSRGAVRTARPPGEPPRSFSFPEFARHRLANGFEIRIARRPTLPRVEASLLLPAGGDRNPANRPGLASLVAALVDEGSVRRSGTELALAIERLGGTLTTGADWDAASAELALLAPDLEEGIEALAEVARAPVFPAGDVERLQRQTLAEILRRFDRPGVVADESFVASLYPDSPYGFPLRGTAASLEAVNRDQIVAFHLRAYRPAGAHLVLAGDLDPARTLALVEARFGDWVGGEGVPARDLRTPQAGAPEVLVVDLPRAAQTELRIGCIGVPRAHPDRTLLGLLNAVLGGKFISRLNLALRERLGLTYGVSSRWVDRRGAGPFLVATAVATDGAGRATAETLAELRRLGEEPIPEVELAEAKSYLLGVFPYTLQTLGGLVARLGDLALHGLPDDHFAVSLSATAAARADDLLALARRHLSPAAMTVVAVGPAAELAPQLEGFGQVRVLRPLAEASSNS
jgi:zinc protease